MNKTHHRIIAIGALILSIAAVGISAALMPGGEEQRVAQELGNRIESIGYEDSAEQRAAEAAKRGIWGWEDTHEQKLALLNAMPADDELGFAVATDFQKNLSAPMTQTQDFIPVTSLTLKDGETLTMAALGDKVFVTLEPGATKEEIAMCTGIDTATVRFTGCTRGLAFSGPTTTAVSANQKTHSSGATIVLSNVHYVYNQYLDKTASSTTQNVAGPVVFFTNPAASSTTALPDGPASYVTQYYASTLVAGGFSNLNIDTAYGLTAAGTVPEKVRANLSTFRYNAIELDESSGTSVRALLSRPNIVWATSTAAVDLTQFRAVVATTTGNIYHTDTAYTSSTFKFVGFVASSTNAGQTVYIAGPGSMLCGFSSLTAGSNYYLNGTGGQIATTPPSGSGNLVARVGLALTTTCLQVLPPKYMLTGNLSITNTTAQRVTTNFYPTRVTILAGRDSSAFRQSISIGGDVGDTSHLTLIQNASSTGVDSFDATQNWILYNNLGGQSNLGQITNKDATGFTITPVTVDFNATLSYIAESD